MWTDVLARCGLDCADGLTACATDPAVCASKGGSYLGVEWAQCPVREAMSDPYVQAVAALEASSKLAPVSGWPDTFSVWVPSLWSELRALIADRRDHAARQGQNSGG